MSGVSRQQLGKDGIERLHNDSLGHQRLDFLSRRGGMANHQALVIGADRIADVDQNLTGKIVCRFERFGSTTERNGQHDDVGQIDCGGNATALRTVPDFFSQRGGLDGITATDGNLVLSANQTVCQTAGHVSCPDNGNFHFVTPYCCVDEVLPLYNLKCVEINYQNDHSLETNHWQWTDC